MGGPGSPLMGLDLKCDHESARERVLGSAAGPIDHICVKEVARCDSPETFQYCHDEPESWRRTCANKKGPVSVL